MLTLSDTPSTPLDRNATELIGVVDRIIWQSPPDSADPGIVASLRETKGGGAGGSLFGAVVTGPLDDMSGGSDGDGLAQGVSYRFLGKWEEHERHGLRFKFSTYIQDTPATRPGVIKYLTDTAPNIGTKKADALWEYFGADAVRICREEPAAVVDAGLLTHEQAAEAAAALVAVQALERTRIDLFSLFAGRGFPGTLVRSCIARWGAKAPSIIRRNPFILLTESLPGCGFKRVDRLYLDLGFGGARRKRAMFAAWNALRTDSTGHTWHRLDVAEQAVRTACGATVDPIPALVLGKRGGWLATRKTFEGSRGQVKRIWIAEAEKAGAERRLADAVKRLCKLCVTSWPDPGKLEGVSEHQRGRAAAAMARPVGILAGSPGTGKTFTLASIVKEILASCGHDAVAVAAPTGKAAVRIMATLQRYGITLPATTIHRLLEIGRNGHDGSGWGFQRNKKNPLDQRYIIIDEWSMGDTSLAADLFEACADGTHVLLVGDVGQLPPVGHGAPLRDMIAAGVPTGELSEIMRNAGMIIEACAAIKAGKPFRTVPLNGNGNLQLIETRTAAESVAKLHELLDAIRQAGKHDPVWDAQVLVAMNKKSEVARVPLNSMLQNFLNPTGESIAGNPFRVGDKIICLKNCWVESAPDASAAHAQRGEVYLANGEVGRVESIEPRVTFASFTLPERRVKIPMAKPRREEGESGGDEEGRGSNFDLAFSVTGHKSQGSEFPISIVMIDENAGMVASREWVYTAISRARDLCVLIGKKATVEKQCRRVSLGVRKTFLRELLA